MCEQCDADELADNQRAEAEENARHIQTIVHGDISPYYYRDCSCGWQGSPSHSIGEAMEDSCPYARPSR